MQLPRAVFHILQVLTLLLALAIFAAIAYFFVTADVDTGVSDTVRKAEVARMQSTAHAYFARLNYFDGVCDAIGAEGDVTCNDAEAGYAIATVLSDGTYYCADHTGFSGVTARWPGSAIRCNQ